MVDCESSNFDSGNPPRFRVHNGAPALAVQLVTVFVGPLSTWDHHRAPHKLTCFQWGHRPRSARRRNGGDRPHGRKSGRNAVSRCYLKLRSSLFGRVCALIRKGWGVGERQTELERARADSQSVSQSVITTLLPTEHMVHTHTLVFFFFRAGWNLCICLSSLQG